MGAAWSNLIETHDQKEELWTEATQEVLLKYQDKGEIVNSLKLHVSEEWLTLLWEYIILWVKYPIHTFRGIRNVSSIKNNPERGLKATSPSQNYQNKTSE